ncbi:MAG TPA: UvrB/UvrC motif-containing protein [Gemmatimonadaceae bacterium]|nr:UvrB/UvrC motif-containing protein [Gemmatimonadaceae bacterium]
MPRTPPATDAQLAAMRGVVRADAADRPGVYRMLAEDGEVLYVGKSKRVRTRLLSYFRCAYPEEKGARIVREARQIDWEYTPSEFAALLHELRLIKRFRPRFNTMMKRDARHYAFIKLTRGAAPKLLVVRGAGSEDGGTYYGPFLGAQRVGEAVRELGDALGLRDCALDRRMYFADQQELFQLTPRTPGCIRLEIRKCLGPCVGACTERDYDERVRLARAFLDGVDDGPMVALRAEMEACAERLEFERAAACRDKLRRLEVLREQFGRLRFAVETLSFVYTVPGHEGDDRVYVVRRGRVRHEQAAPRSARDRRALADRVAAIFAAREHEGAAVPAHEIDELLLLSSWFRRFPAELARTAAPPGVMQVARTA